MRTGLTVFLCLGMLAGVPALAQTTPSRNLPTPSTPGPNPGAAATDAIVNPARPPAEVAPSTGASPAAPSPRPPGASPAAPAPRSPPTAMAPSSDELLEAVRATAKATRESVEYGRVVPDILTQILAKLDKIEDKLDKVENAVKGTRRR